MKKAALATIGALGAATLVVAGCSSTTSGTQNEVAEKNAPSEAPSSAVTATPRLGDVPYDVSLTCTFDVRGILVPAGTTAINVLAVGAAGDLPVGPGGGQGGAVSATLPFNDTWGTTLYAKVGCQGGNTGGWPNGGKGGPDNYGGGGSTSLETTAQAFTPIIIAGGGGGTGGGSDNPRGGSGGNSDGSGGGGTGDCGGGGASQAGGGGGRNGGSSGTLGHGGNAGTGEYADGGGGGGGYYGGGGGCGSHGLFDKTVGSGGAGSSWVVPSAGNVTYTVSSIGNGGFLGLTFMCGADPCSKQTPTPTTS